MDPFKLVELPLTTLIFAVFLYVTLQVFKWAGEIHVGLRERNNFVDQFDIHIAFNHGVFRRAFRDISADIDELDRQSATDDGKSEVEPPRQGFGFLALLGQFLPHGGARKTAPHPQEGNDFVVTKGFLDVAQVAAHLDKFSRQRAGLALYFIEQYQLLLGMFEMLNRLNDDLSQRDALLGHLLSLRNALAEALLVSRALSDPDLRRVLLAHPEQADALFARSFPDLLTPSVGAGTGDDNNDATAPGKHIGGGQGGDTARPVDLRFDGFRFPDRRRSWLSAAAVFVLPGLLVLGFAIVLLRSDYIRGQIFPANTPQIACSVTQGPGPDDRKVSCAYAAPSLADGLSRGLTRGD